MKLNDVLAAMRAGAWLHLTLADGPRWQLNDGATATTVNSRTVAGMIKRGHIAGNNDSRSISSLRKPGATPAQRSLRKSATEAHHENHWRR